MITWVNTKALSYYEKDLEISEKSLPPNHPDLAISYNNIGLVYDNMGEYSKALLLHEKAIGNLPKNSSFQSSSFGYFVQQYRISI